MIFRLVLAGVLAIVLGSSVAVLWTQPSMQDNAEINAAQEWHLSTQAETDLTQWWQIVQTKRLWKYEAINKSAELTTETETSMDVVEPWSLVGIVQQGSSRKAVLQFESGQVKRVAVGMLINGAEVVIIDFNFIAVRSEIDSQIEKFYLYKNEGAS